MPYSDSPSPIKDISDEDETGEFESNLSFMLLLVMVVAGDVFSHMREIGAMPYCR
jgi:hypothetical protein